MKEIPTTLLVVSVALVRKDGHVLMQRRPAHRQHGGLWEFPGGKVEPGEGPAAALVREIDEELGLALDPADLAPVAFADDGTGAGTGGGGAGMVLLLFVCRRWQGDPRAEPGAEIGWFAPADLAALAMPPLDVPLAAALVARAAGNVLPSQGDAPKCPSPTHP